MGFKNYKLIHILIGSIFCIPFLYFLIIVPSNIAFNNFKDIFNLSVLLAMAGGILIFYDIKII